MVNLKQTIAVIGATGQIGRPLSKHLLADGHHVKLISRKPLQEDKSGHLQALQELGGEVVVVPDMNDSSAMAGAFAGADTVVCAVPATKEIVTESQRVWLKAAVEANVKRFVPNEFGLHTKGVDWGEGVLFDYKKEFHRELFKANIGWTLFYNGGIFDYFLPNLRFFDKITTFGDMDTPIFTHEIEDIGRCAALAVTDPRTMNKCVQMDFNILSQKDMLDMLKKNFPSHPFEYRHHSAEEIVEKKKNASNEVTAKKGAETDAERWGINYCIYVKGKLASFTDDTVRATELYPDFKVSASPASALADPKFVFEAK